MHHHDGQFALLRESRNFGRPRAVFVGAFLGAPEAAVFVPLRRWSLRRAFFATFSRCTFMKLCQHPSIQKEAPEQELSGASFFRTCISLCASEAVFGRRRERRSITRRPRRCPNLCLRGRYFSSFPCRRAGRLRVVAQHVFFYCGVDVREGFSTASNGAAALKKPPCPKLCFRAAVFCDLFAPLRHRAGSTAPQVGERKCKKARPRASMTVH